MFERRHDSLETPAHGWSLYLVEAGIIKQRYPGAYKCRGDAEVRQREYQELLTGQQLVIMPYDEDVPK